MKNYQLTFLTALPLLLPAFANATTAQDVARISNQVGQNQLHITSNSKKISEYKQDSRQVASALLIYGHSNDSRIAKDEQAIADNVTSVNTNKQKIDADVKQTQLNRHNIQTTNHLLQKDEKLVEANTRGIYQTRQALHSDELQIQANADAIKSLKQDLERMADDIDGAYANAAALNGLTEPHNVGNVMISVGLGHHGSADAIAFGAGERFNEHFAAKVGTAYNSGTSSMTTYVGMGYEF